MIPCQMSFDQAQSPEMAPPITGIPSQQPMSRSKSLNDLLDESQAFPFASTRCIYSRNSGVCARDSSCPHPNMAPQFQNCTNSHFLGQSSIKDSGNYTKNICDSSTPGISSNFNSNIAGDMANQCAIPPRFNLCNQVANNLNGVTEQIGNLHL